MDGVRPSPRVSILQAATLNNLTASQQQAVDHKEGPLLVLAGPGSGKTRVITHRIAQLVQSGVHPYNILAITFTNKAAREMGERVEALLPDAKIWVSTFHRFCAQLLRKHARGVGLQPNYTILDTSDQRRLLKSVLIELGHDVKHFPPAKVAARISSSKNRLVGPEEFALNPGGGIGDTMLRVVTEAYPAYQRALQDSNAVDFDDLLLHVARLLEENPALRSQLDERFQYVLVDEYQDTNLPQYRIVRALSQDYPNLCATGDPDQSIYAWRGAEIGNILRFEQDYPDAKVVRLEHNFRSTKAILRQADLLIGHNFNRKAKELLTENDEGPPVELLTFTDGAAEAEGIALRIQDLVDQAGRAWSDFAIFYRVNALSRSIERALARFHIPYQVAAGVGFYDRAEVKDIVAYLRLIANPADRTAFERVVNVPARGIGKTTLTRLTAWATGQGGGLLEAAARAEEVPKLTKRAVKALHGFYELISQLSQRTAQGVAELITQVVTQTGYDHSWLDDPTEQNLERAANVDELISAARQYDAAHADDATLEGFLEESSLINDVDSLDEHAGSVTLMTLHAAKGLEYPVVFVVGVEQNLLPHERAINSDDPHELEEERRLLFVGMTRAEEQLMLTQTAVRDIRGQRLSTIPSPFLFEMDLAATVVETDSEYIAWDDDYAHDDSLDDFEPIIKQRPEEEAPRPQMMTAADLLNGTNTPTEIPRGFSIGMDVRHPQYGVGTVRNVDGFGRRKTVTVEFAAGECRNFDIAKSPLQPVGQR